MALFSTDLSRALPGRCCCCCCCCCCCRSCIVDGGGLCNALPCTCVSCWLLAASGGVPCCESSGGSGAARREGRCCCCCCCWAGGGGAGPPLPPAVCSPCPSLDAGRWWSDAGVCSPPLAIPGDCCCRSCREARGVAPVSACSCRRARWCWLRRCRRCSVRNCCVSCMVGNGLEKKKVRSSYFGLAGRTCRGQQGRAGSSSNSSSPALAASRSTYRSPAQGMPSAPSLVSAQLLCLR